MFNNGSITYGATESVFGMWRPKSEILHALLVSALTTLLSFQVTDIMFDIFFGLKPHGRSKASNMQILRLARRNSPLAIFRNVFPYAENWNALVSPQNQRHHEKQYVTDMHSDTSSSDNHPPTRLHSSRLFKLIFIVMVAPLANVMAISLTLERDSFLTFKEAEFGGLAMGLRPEPEPGTGQTTENEVHNCRLVPVKTSEGEDALIKFFECFGRPVARSLDFDNQAAVFVSKVTANTVAIEIYGGIVGVAMSKSMMMSASTPDKKNTTVYFLKSNFSRNDAKELVNYGMELLAPYCKESISRASGFQGFPDGIDESGRYRAEFQFYKDILCPGLSVKKKDEIPDDSWREVAMKMTSRIGTKNSEKLEVAQAGKIRDETIKFDDGEFTAEDAEALDKLYQVTDNLVFLKRRRSYASDLALCVLVASVLVVRIVTWLVTRNDVKKGIELVVRSGLGLSCCDSLLCCTDVIVNYGKDVPRERGGWVQVRSRHDKYSEDKLELDDFERADLRVS